jgi:iron complex outermembrane receptor protein
MTKHNKSPHHPAGFAGWLAMLLLVTGVGRAQTGTGIITGRVYNPETNQYVANAEVDVQGMQLADVTAADGSYRLLRVPAGQATVTVSYTGYTSTPATVQVAAGETVVQNFNLRSSGAAAEEVLKLQAFTVTGEKEGAAKEIQLQKESMTVSTMVSSESFGDMPEGNVGEFIKFLPEIAVDYVEAEARSPRIRGLPAQFTTVTFDHMRLASADAFIQNNGTDNGGGAGAGDRSFGFDQVSLGTIDAVQVNYTVNAALDADAAAGNINLVPRHAFERKGQLISFKAMGMWNGESAYFSPKFGPDDAKNSQVRPNLQFEYANSFFDNRVGLDISLGEADTYEQQRQFAPSYDTTPTAANPSPYVMTGLIYKDGPTLDKRPTAGVTLDFKANEYLTAGVIWQGTGLYHLVGNRTFGLISTRANIQGDGTGNWTNVPITSVSSSMAYLNKRTFGQSLVPNAEYKRGDWDINLVGLVSKATNNYAGGESDSFPGNTVGGTSLSTTGMTASASHPADNFYAWTVRQTAGLDFGNINNWKASATGYPTFSEDGRFTKNISDQLELDLKYTTPFAWPTWIQFGPKISEATYDYMNSTSWQVWDYIGPGGGLGGGWSAIPASQFYFTPGNGASILSDTGAAPMVQDHNAIGYLFKSNPEDFVLANSISAPTSAAAAYYSAFIVQPKYVREQIDAGYAMFDTRPIHGLEIQGGARVEKTIDEVKNYTSLTPNQVAAAGYPVSATSGLATTAAGINYQFQSHPRAVLSKDYSNLFPSASVKYSFNRDLIALFGYSYTITRPSYGDLAGVTDINTDATPVTITLPNTNLKPQYSNNYTFNLTQYFDPAGQLGLSLFENDFKNYTQQSTLLNAGVEFGFPDYPDASVTTKVNLPGTTVFRGMALDYRQALSFLPHPFDGLRIFANWTRTYIRISGIAATVLEAATPYNYGWLPGVPPNVVNYGISFSSYRFHFALNANWRDRTPYSGTYNTWEKSATHLDGSASVTLTRNIRLVFSAHNILDVPDYVYIGDPHHLASRDIEYYGAYFYSGVQFVY